jgi:hypothetical protein
MPCTIFSVSSMDGAWWCSCWGSREFNKRRVRLLHLALGGPPPSPSADMMSQEFCHHHRTDGSMQELDLQIIPSRETLAPFKRRTRHTIFDRHAWFTETRNTTCTTCRPPSHSCSVLWHSKLALLPPRSSMPRINNIEASTITIKTPCLDSGTLQAS